MKITDLRIDGFGIWSGLELEDVPPGITVLHGPNESGKTTLLEFIRGALFGLSQQQRRRYLPPRHGGEPGGAIDVQGPDGAYYYLARYANGADGRLVAVSDEAVQTGTPALETLLGRVDEETFNNVFALGYDEVQQFGTLANEELNRRLYEVTAGVDHVSLSQVTRRLTESRRRLLDPDAESSQIAELVQRRAALRDELERFATQRERYAALTNEREQLAAQLEQWRRRRDELDYPLRVIDAAQPLRDKLQNRDELAARLTAAGDAPSVPRDALKRLEHYAHGAQRLQDRLLDLKQKRDAAKAELAELKINQNLADNAQRLSSLVDQQEWIAQQALRVVQLEDEVAELRYKVDGESDAGEDDNSPLHVAGRHILHLRSLSDALRECQSRVEQATREVQRAERTEQAAAASAQQSRRDVVQLQGKDLSDAIGQVTERVEALRSRVRLDERIERMQEEALDLERRGHESLDRSLMPTTWTIGLASLFVMGVVLLLFSVAGFLGWMMATLGVLAIVGAVVTKYVYDRYLLRSLDDCQQRLDTLLVQLREAKRKRDKLDRKLPEGGGPMTQRLKKAEDELARLERLMPLESGQTDAERGLLESQERGADAKEALDVAQGELERAEHDWREGLREAGLPNNFSPRKVNLLRERNQPAASEWPQRLRRRQRELEEASLSRDHFLNRMKRLARECDLQLPEGDAVEQLTYLQDELCRNQVAIRRRDSLQADAKRIRRRWLGVRKRRRLCLKQRRKLLALLDAENDEVFRRKLEQYAAVHALRRRAAELDLEILGHLAGGVTEAAVRQLLAGPDANRLPRLREELLAQRAQCDEELRRARECHEQIGQQLQSTANDGQVAETRFDLGLVEERLRGAVRRWQTLALATALLERVRREYENKHQPDVLRRASGYFQRLTQGRYTRVWTPLDEDTLRIDTADGQETQPAILSRGTREQLYLCLRLALADSFAERGVRLPMVLDDVLVNFDDRRARLAAELLCDFAAGGHQLFVFTRHAHIARLFEELQAPVRYLPAVGGIETPLPEETPVSEEALAPAISAQAEPARRIDKPHRGAEPKPAAVPASHPAEDAPPEEPELAAEPPAEPEIQPVAAEPAVSPVSDAALITYNDEPVPQDDVAEFPAEQADKDGDWIDVTEDIVSARPASSGGI